MIDYKILGVVKLIDSLDQENPVTTVLDGFLVNTANEKFDGLDDYLVEPANPYNVYASPAVTYFYKFPDKETAETLLAPFLPPEE